MSTRTKNLDVEVYRNNKKITDERNRAQKIREIHGKCPSLYFAWIHSY